MTMIQEIFGLYNPVPLPFPVFFYAPRFCDLSENHCVFTISPIDVEQKSQDLAKRTKIIQTDILYQCVIRSERKHNPRLC